MQKNEMDQVVIEAVLAGKTGIGEGLSIGLTGDGAEEVAGVTRIFAFARDNGDTDKMQQCVERVPALSGFMTSKKCKAAPIVPDEDDEGTDRQAVQAKGERMVGHRLEIPCSEPARIME